jgi:ribonuclease P protein component
VLKRDRRLRAASSIDLVYKKARPVHGAFLSVRALPRPSGATGSRGAVIVSKKVAKLATTRNRLRRRVQAVLTPRWATFGSPYDIVVSIKSDFSDLSPAELEAELSAVLRRAGVI